MLTFMHAASAVLNWDGFEGSFDFPGSIEANLVHQLIEPRVVEDRFDFGEDGLDWIQGRTVRHIVDGHDVEHTRHSLHLLGFVHS